MFTKEQLERRDHKLHTFDVRVHAVMTEMRRGALLHVSFGANAPTWRLSSGRVVPPTIARAVVARKSIVACGDSLFPQTLSQTWKWRTER
jgi:hypothetical protein